MNIIWLVNNINTMSIIWLVNNINYVNIINIINRKIQLLFDNNYYYK